MSKTRSELNTVVESEMLSKTVKDIQQSELHSALIAACMCSEKQHMQTTPVNIYLGPL